MKDEQSDPYAQCIVFFGIAGIFALFFSFIHGGFHYQITVDQLLLFLPLALCTTVGPVLLFKSFQLIDASENAILQSSQKLWTVLGAFIFLHELFSSKKLSGTMITIIGIAFAFWNKKKFILNRGVLFVLMATIFYKESR
jgi:drug/metabolite transporter (DMT)-like permease